MRERPLRICFVAYRGNMRCGGQGIYLWFLARELAKRGHRVDVLVGPPYPDPMPFANEVVKLPNHQFWGKWFDADRTRMLPADAPLRVFSPLSFYELGASRLGFLPEPFAFSWRAFRNFTARWRSGERYDLVHDVQCLGYGLLGVRAHGVPIVTTIHHPLSVDRRASFIRDQTFTDALGTMKFYPIGMQSFVARRVSRVLTSSRVSARAIARDFAVDPARIVNVANGIDTDLFRPDAAVPRSASELVCVGRASDPNKGVRTLVAALAHLPAEVRLTLVDSDSTGGEVRRWAREFGVGARIRIARRVSTPQLVDLYRRAALVVVPSHYEGFGLPAVEAMACGTAVVSTRAGALPEVMRIGGGGLLVERGDPEALAKGVRALLEQPETRAALGARARPRIEAAFSWPRVSEATIQVYRELTECDARGRPARTTTSASPGNRRATASSA
jgi:glycosyltransferase involved in cell wall biosynthesis